MKNSNRTSNDVVFTSHNAGTALSPMSPSDFYMFFEHYVFGGQLLQQFEPEKGFDYLFKGEIMRYTPDLIPASHAPSVLIDLDDTISPLRIPSAIWKYAFEVGALPYQIGTEYGDHHIKVLFVSKKHRIICKASLQVLLLLAQEKYPLATLDNDQFDSLTEYWGSIYDFLDRCGSDDPQDLHGDINLLIDTSKILELIALVQEKRGLVNLFVEEVWNLHVSERSSQKDDFTFEWEHLFFRDQAVKDLYDQWLETPWITRCTQLGEMYSYPVFQVTAGERSSLISFEKCELLPPQSLPIHVIKNFPGELFLLRNLPVQWQEHWYYHLEIPLAQFIQFYRQIFHIDLQVVNINKGVFIFQEVTASDSLMASFIVLKGKHAGLAAEGYSAGLYLTTWLINPYRKEDLRLRLFEFCPGEEIQEYDFAAFKEVCAPLLGSFHQQFSDLVQYLRILRTEEHFFLDFSLSDIFGHPEIRSVWEGPVGFRAIVGAWVPSEDSIGKEIRWVPRFASPEDLQIYLVQNFGEEDDTSLSSSASHPVMALLDEMIDIVEVLNEENVEKED